MALTVIETPGAADANSYVSIAEFDAYCEAHVDGAAVIAPGADAEKKKRCVIQATRQFEAYVDWDGTPATPSVQALAWPRAGMYMDGGGLYDPTTHRVVPSTEIPTRLKNAVCEQARLLFASGDRAAEQEQQVQGLTRLAVGSGAVDMTFKPDAVARQVIAPSAWQFVACWGRLRQPGRGGAVPLARM